MTKLVKVKLNEKYFNDFLTTGAGLIFHKKNNSQGKPETIMDISLDVHENQILLEQGLLVLVEDESDEKEAIEKMPKVEESKTTEPQTQKDDTKIKHDQDNNHTSQVDHLDTFETVKEDAPNNTIKD